MSAGIPNLVIITPVQTFLTRSFAVKLNEKSIISEEVKPQVNKLSEYNKDIDGMVIFATEEIVEDMTLLVFIKDMAIGRDIPVFAIGRPEDISSLEAVFPSNVLKGAYMRPVDINVVVDSVSKYLSFFSTSNRKSILVVDDSGAALRSAKGMFEDKYHVMLADSAAMAIMSLANNIPDLILLDYDMPIIDGKQVFEMIKNEAKFSDIPVMFLTGKDDVASVTSIMKLRPVAYMLKNRPAAEIIKTVDGFFQKQKANIT